MSDMINLNSTEFDGSGPIFNGGKAGVVENVKVSVEKKTADKAMNYPDYKLKFTDSTGGSIDKGFYYLDDAHEKFAAKLKGLGVELKHVWGAVIGKDKPIPEFTGHKEMLDTMMSSFNTAVKEAPDKLYRTVVAYGNAVRPEKYLRIPFFPPYIESMSVKSEESRITIPRNARMIPFVEDARDDTHSDVHTDVDVKGWD